MGKHSGRHVGRRSKSGMAAIAVVFMMMGFLLSTNVRINRSVTVTSDTSQLLNERSRKVSELQDDISDLSGRIDALKTLTDDSQTSVTDDVDSGSRLPAVEGPGLIVTLDDSPLWQNRVDGTGSSADINDYVVHQQDLEGVINALWAGGAEAMTIANQRVLSNTAVRCVGTVVTVHGKRVPPPYVIRAIGPIDDMRAALDRSPTVMVYKEYVESVGLGWDVEESDDLRFAETTNSLQTLQYAKAAGGQ